MLRSCSLLGMPGKCLNFKSKPALRLNGQEHTCFKIYHLLIDQALARIFVE
jgi:hypothetical protein